MILQFKTSMQSPRKPLYLLADSQLLFWQDQGHYFLQSAIDHIGHPQPATIKAAYLGASNGDQPEFFELFQQALGQVGVIDCRMIRSGLDADDAHYLAQADLILLAGGDVALGWQAFRASGVDAILARRYAEGALIMGISAGAVQLGTHGWPEAARRELFPTLNLLPYLIDAHDERSDWGGLQTSLRCLPAGARAIGIASGAGLICYPDQTLQAVRHAFPRFVLAEGGGIEYSHLLFA
jgi:peptidase E